MYELASVTNALVELATNVVNALGLPGVFLLIFAGSTGIPLSSEAVMLLASCGVYSGPFSLLAVIGAGAPGDLAGASSAWVIGYFGRAELPARHGAGAAFLFMRRRGSVAAAGA